MMDLEIPNMKTEMEKSKYAENLEGHINPEASAPAEE